MCVSGSRRGRSALSVLCSAGSRLTITASTKTKPVAARAYLRSANQLLEYSQQPAESFTSLGGRRLAFSGSHQPLRPFIARSCLSATPISFSSVVTKRGFAATATPTSSAVLGVKTGAGSQQITFVKMPHYEITMADGANGGPYSPGTPTSVTSMSSVGSTISARSMSTGREQSDSESDLEKGSKGPNPEAEGGKKPSRFRVLMQQYGRVAIVMYLLVTAVDLALCVWAVWLGGDGLVYTINSYLGQYITRLQKAAQKMEEGHASGTDRWATIILVGYAVHKCLTPLRLALTAAILPWSARTAQRLGWSWLIPKTAPTITHKPMSKAADAIRRKLK
ncbi:hypothetical protein COEREDRAFT_82768 [Coemansia reversa NRRL 1564]|uniref:DUF1279 domain-containing protein n=1 Tax=Coemansia reversa (strain ATCC 12441 / NRRL 1564) TaxID=763665 RepID=A0A2G5B702_COERN|nr:hypothetical protein COEREDRAFT_82768 [Coemansia reversa NRRL 1564]|eukprot:PIA14507.1 hypothetical protein COEREDRAFT_82768 [Coemansia reversa NRRL 1564]